MSPANMKNSLAWSSKAFASATTMTITLPKAVMSSTDFMESGACKKENSSPVMLPMTYPTVITTYCGSSHQMDTELAEVRVNWVDLTPDPIPDRTSV